MHVVEYVIDSYDLRRRGKLTFCVQDFIADLELQDLTHAEGNKHEVGNNQVPADFIVCIKLRTRRRLN